jgi:hypothetical protein
MFELKKTLLAGVAMGALIAPAVAYAQVGGDPSTNQPITEINSTWDNSVEVELEWSLDVSKDLDIRGDIRIDGTVHANALAQATLDDKQTMSDNSVQFEDYQNVNSFPGDTNVLAEPAPGTSTAHPATYTNTINAGAAAAGVTATGNVGINLVAGDYNLQENAAVLASADAGIAFLSGTELGGGNLTVASGGAEAGSFSLQNLFDVGFNDTTYDIQNSVVSNTVSVGAGTLDGASGNIGLNAAAGAFNIQKNALVIASVTGGNLAEATAGVWQNSNSSTSYNETVTNTVNLGDSLTNASGNIGVNLASGTGNLQLNSLTMASATAGAAAPTAPTTPTTPTAPTAPTSPTV